MSKQTETPWLSDGTQKLRTDARKTINELEAVALKIAAGLATDAADVERQAEALTPQYVKRDLLTAKLERTRATLFNSIVEDAKQAYDAAVDRAGELRAKKAALRDLWRRQVNVDVKDIGARETLSANSRYWPAELRDVDTELAHALQAMSDAARRVASVDWDTYATKRAAGVAIPCGGWEGKPEFWNRVAAIAPELGTAAAGVAGTQVVWM